MEKPIKLFNVKTCLYCKTDFNPLPWKSAWEKEFHYKTIKCSCGKESWFKVDFQGSGHDTIITKETISLESVVRMVCDVDSSK